MRLDFARRAKMLTLRNTELAAIYAKRLLRRPVLLDHISSEQILREFYLTLNAGQRAEICLPWDYTDARRGLVRTFIANHWQVTRPCVRGDFFSAEQRSLIFQIYCSLLAPAWRRRFIRQLSNDTYGHRWGQDQSIAIFGDPLAPPYQFAFTGRHVTLRVDGDPASVTAFGGPVVYAHAATGFGEQPHHPGNIFWEQAVLASKLHDALDQTQQAQAETDELPEEHDIAFPATPRGAPAAAFTAAQRRHLETLLHGILAPFRAEDQAAVRRCLAAQGGIDALHIAFGRARRMSAPLWDDWRLEGPAFVWHFRGAPHVHAWVNVAEHPSALANAHSGAFIFPEHDPL